MARIGSEGLNVQGTPYWGLRKAKAAAQKLANEQRTRISVEDIATGKTLAVVGPNKFSNRSNPAVKLPSKFTPAEVRVNEQGKVQIRINPAKLGSGGRFAKCVESVEAKGGAVDPRAVCAAAGRKKYGAKKFAAMGRAGRKQKNPASHYLKGWVAIQFAEKHGIRYVSKYADPIEDGKARVTLERAKKIAREDPGLIYLRTSKSFRLSR
jgi:hypothetical protein